ncbi:MAG: metallophosphoesterase family protein [Planctomycetota bacterium]
MKILVISDIHGNIAALNAIQERADMVFCLGDLVNYGPYPGECITKIRGMTDKVVRGNHDNAIGRNLGCGCSERYKELSNDGKAFTVAALNNDEKSFLGNLPLTLNLRAAGKRFLFSHASPGGDIHKYLRPDAPDAEFITESKGVDADIVFIGHTHLPMVREVNGITYINPGSVGQPRDGIPLASYAVWEDGCIEIKRVSYDREATVLGLQQTTISPTHVATLSRILRNGGM